MERLDFWWDPDWDAHECSWYPVGCCPHGYDVNDAYPSHHHHHFRHMSVTPLTPTVGIWGPDYIPYDNPP